jgi:hypothetical protein
MAQNGPNRFLTEFSLRSTTSYHQATIRSTAYFETINSAQDCVELFYQLQFIPSMSRFGSWLCVTTTDVQSRLESAFAGNSSVVQHIARGGQEMALAVSDKSQSL